MTTSTKAKLEDIKKGQTNNNSLMNKNRSKNKHFIKKTEKILKPLY